MLFLLFIVFFGFILVPFEEHNIGSYSIFVLLSIGLFIVSIKFNRKKSWAIQFLLAFNISMSLIVGCMLIIASFYVGKFVMLLTLLGILGFIIVNNNLLLDAKIQRLFNISKGRFTLLCVVNYSLPILLIIYFFMNFQNI